jgi:hypothetical protein
MPLLPSAFLLRVAYPCLHVKEMPRERGEELLDLPPECRIESLGTMDGMKNFADVRLAWNEFGIGVRVAVSGKKDVPQGDIKQPRASDGFTLWLDTRDSRSSHRASRYCHQFHLLPVGGGSDLDEPVFVQTKINRALHDAPLVTESAVRFRGSVIRGGYIVEAFLPAAALNGYDPEQNRRLGVCYAIRDRELGEMTLGLDADFPFAEDPSLWSVLELTSDREDRS